jgi:hypothetical protein
VSAIVPPRPNAGYTGFTSLQECKECGCVQFVVMPQGTDEWPIMTAECTRCGENACRQVGPPTFSLNT